MQLSAHPTVPQSNLPLIISIRVQVPGTTRRKLTLSCTIPQAWYFDRDDVALPGFHKFFARASAEERIHAEALMAYQNRRGGRIVLQNIKVITE